MIRRTLMLIGLALGLGLSLGWCPTASAATSRTSTTTVRHSTAIAGTMIGPRVGFSVNPDQFVVGGHLSTGFAPGWTLNPSVELGFGDNATVTALNFDAEYHFDIQRSNWSPYLGAGLGVDFISIDVPAPFSDVHDTVTGLNLIVGTTIPTASSQHLFSELRIGTGDSAIPDLKGVFGWNFALR